MFCSNCGEKISKHDNFCMNCGTKLKQSNPPEDNYEKQIFKERVKRPKFNNDILGYFKKSLLKPRTIIDSNDYVYPIVPIIILLSWILINTFLTISAIKNTIKTVITKIIESIPMPELTSGSEYVDDFVSTILGESDWLPEWANTDYLIDNLFDYVNPYYISIMLMIFILLAIAYNMIFLYFVPLRERSLSKIITDYITLYFIALVSTSAGLIFINFGFIYPGVFLIIFSVIYSLLMPLYLLLYYSKNREYKFDLIYSIIIYIFGIMMIYFIVLHGVILKTINNFTEQINIITDIFTNI